MGTIGRDRDRRPADAETLGDLGPAQPVDERSARRSRAGDRSGRRGARRGAAPSPSSRSSIAGIAADDRDPLAAGGRRRETLAGGDEGRAAALRGGTRARVDLAATTTQRIGTAVGVERGPEDRPGRIGRRGEQALELVALGELERREPVATPGRPRSDRRAGSAARPSRPARRGASGSTSPKRTMRVHVRRLIRPSISRQRLISGRLAARATRRRRGRTAAGLRRDRRQLSGDGSQPTAAAGLVDDLLDPGPDRRRVEPQERIRVDRPLLDPTVPAEVEDRVDRAGAVRLERQGEGVAACRRRRPPSTKAASGTIPSSRGPVDGSSEITRAR